MLPKPKSRAEARPLHWERLFDGLSRIGGLVGFGLRGGCGWFGWRRGDWCWCGERGRVAVVEVLADAIADDLAPDRETEGVGVLVLG